MYAQLLEILDRIEPRRRRRDVLARAVKRGGLRGANAAFAALCVVTLTIGTAFAVTASDSAQSPQAVSAFVSSQTPAVVADSDGAATEVGVKFRTDVDGVVSAVRYYKASTNTGVHVGSLWAANGTLLSRVTFAAETNSGWQEMSFATPVSIKANTTYVASYHTDAGHYSEDDYFFSRKGVSRGPLRLLRSRVAGANGVYAHSASPAFPTHNWHSANYWVDVVFAPAGTVPTTAALPTAASTATSQPTVTGGGTVTPVPPIGSTTTTTTTTTVAPAPPTSPPAGSSSVQPNATNTGVPTGTALTVRNGDFHFTADNQVVSGLDIHGAVFVDGHDNVRLQNSRISGSENWMFANFLVNGHVGVNAVIDHVEIAGVNGPHDNAAIGYANVTCRYCDIHGTTDGMRGGTDLSLEHSFIHDLVPYSVNNGHSDGYQLTDTGGGHITDSSLCGDNSAVFLKSDFGPIDSVTVDHNWLDCGNYTFYSRSAGSPAPTNIRFINNIIGRGAQYGAASIDGTIYAQNNVWQGTLALIKSTDKGGFTQS